MKSDLVFEPQKLKMKKSVQFKEDFELCEVFLYSFPCDICEFRMANKRKLEKHLLRHYKGPSIRHKLISIAFSAVYLATTYFALSVFNDYFGIKEQEELKQS